MTIANALTALNQDIVNARTAITNKGGTVTLNGGSSQLATDIATIPSGGGSVTLERIKDDSNNEIGTYFMDYTDSNNNKYKVVALDAQYRNSSVKWSSGNGDVTNMPLYNDYTVAFWNDEGRESATTNTQNILNWCDAKGYTSTSCSHCRSKSFVINGITYYGQVPNLKEMLGIITNRVRINSMDTTASSYTTLNLATRHSWTVSLQYNGSYGWCLGSAGEVYFYNKTTTNLYVCPVLEIPNS